ncbi:MAG: hypothetical protein ACRD1E_04020 [Terriglobales bacterium]
MSQWWPGAQARRQRDHALVRAVQLEARLGETVEQRNRLQRELTVAQAALERVVDNAMFAAGAAPVFHPEDARFRPRDVAAQLAEQERARAKPVLTPGEWRRQVELLDREAAERDRKARMAEELKGEAERAKAFQERC